MSLVCVRIARVFGLHRKWRRDKIEEREASRCADIPLQKEFDLNGDSRHQDTRDGDTSIVNCDLAVALDQLASLSDLPRGQLRRCKPWLRIIHSAHSLSITEGARRLKFELGAENIPQLSP